MRRFPRLVERFTGRQATALGCNECGRTSQVPPEAILASYEWANARCPRCGSHRTDVAYEEAPRCGGCGRLGHWVPELDSCCSRRCQLQKEYAFELRSGDDALLRPARSR